MAESFFVALIAVLALTDLVILVGISLWYLHREVSHTSAPTLTEGAVVEGTIGPTATVSSADKPFVDYTLDLTKPGRYTIVLETEQPRIFEPFFVVRRHDNIVDNAFADEGRPEASVREAFIPGRYTIRVTSFDRGRLPSSIHYKLFVMSQDKTSASHKLSTVV